MPIQVSQVDSRALRSAVRAGLASRKRFVQRYFSTTYLAVFI
jgi:hypothetical protein